MLDLVEQGSSWEEVEELATRLEKAGVSIINTELVGMKREFLLLPQWSLEGHFLGSLKDLWEK